jgi:hypothetical protein
LLQHRLQRVSYFLCFVPCRNNDGHQRRPGSQAGAYISQVSYGAIASREVQPEKRESAESNSGQDRENRPMPLVGHCGFSSRERPELKLLVE